MCIFAAVGGILTQIIMNGFRFESGTFGPIGWKKWQDKVQVPPLVGMIIFGCIARNFFLEEHGYMTHYPDTKAGHVRVVCLSVILLRGGLELDFKGKGLTVVLLTFIPQLTEATFAAIASKFIFGFPAEVGIV